MKKLLLLMFLAVYSGGGAFAAENLALGKSSSQSSVHVGLTADRVIDGNTDGDLNNGSVSHTDKNNQPWWQVDMGAVYDFDKISIWNRTDGWGYRLSDFYVFVSDKNINLSHSKVDDILDNPDISAYYVVQAGTQIDIEEDFSGRFVRIQLKSASEYLQLAEVEVWTDVLPICGTVCTEEILEAEYKEGQQACIDDPESCGIELNVEAVAELSPELDLHLPELHYTSPFGTTRYSADLQYVGEKNGDLLWRLSGYKEK